MFFWQKSRTSGLLLFFKLEFLDTFKYQPFQGRRFRGLGVFEMMSCSGENPQSYEKFESNSSLIFIRSWENSKRFQISGVSIVEKVRFEQMWNVNIRVVTFSQIST